MAYITEWFTEIRRDICLLVALNLIFSIVLISQILAPLKGLTGDEPHYLVVTHSIVSDFDLDLQDDYIVDKAWLKFYSGRDLDPHYAPGLDGHYSTRAVGLGVYLVPFYLLGIVSGDIVFWARFAMAVLYVGLMAAVYLICRDLGISRRSSLIAWAFGSFTVPIAFYCYSLYPEVAAGLISILSLRIMNRWDQKSMKAPLLAGILVALLPWLGLKYAVLTVALGVGYFVMVIRSQAALFRSMSYLAIGPFISLVLFAVFLFVLYGTFSPSAIYTGVGEGVRTGAGINWQSAGAEEGAVAGLFRMMLLYFVDQRDGILFYNPLYLFGIAGLLLLIRDKVKPIGMLIFAFGLYLFSYAVSHWTGGQAPPGRPLMAVVWILVMGMAAAFEKIKGLLANLVMAFSTGIAISFTGLFIFNNFLAYHVILAHTETHGNNFLASILAPINLTTLFPNLVNPRDIHPIPVVMAVTLVIALVLILYRSGRDSAALRRSSAGYYGSLTLIAALPLFVFTLAFINAELISPEEMQGDGAVRLVFRDDKTYGYEPFRDSAGPLPSFWQKGGETAKIYIVCGERPENLELTVTSPSPQKVHLSIEGEEISLDFSNKRRHIITVDGKRAVDWMHRALFRLMVTSETGYRPSEHGDSNDTRYLGCRITIKAINAPA